MSDLGLTPGGLATMACLLEVSASKPGNVHRGADFEDVGLNDFLASGVALGQSIDQFASAGIGETVLASIQATKRLTGSNTNLGLVLLLVPLAKLAQETPLSRARLEKQLAEIGKTDAATVYEAIRLVQPGGLGQVDQLDVNESVADAPDSLVEAMQLAADRDLVARQYVNGFQQVFEEVTPSLLDYRTRFSTLSEAIVVTHLSTLAEHGDSLIARKCGVAMSNEAKSRAQRVMDCLPQTSDDLAYEQFWHSVSEFDFWLRSDGHRRNPGATADLIAAGLFVGLAGGDIQPPFG